MREQEEEIRATSDCFMSKPLKKIDLINEMSQFIDWQELKPQSTGKAKKAKKMLTLTKELKEYLRHSVAPLIENYLQSPNTNQLEAIIEQLEKISHQFPETQSLSLELKKDYDNFDIEHVQVRLRKLGKEIQK